MWLSSLTECQALRLPDGFVDDQARPLPSIATHNLAERQLIETIVALVSLTRLNALAPAVGLYEL